MLYIMFAVFWIIYILLWYQLMEGRQSYLITVFDKIVIFLIFFIAVLSVIMVLEWFDLDLKPPPITEENKEHKVRADYGALGDFVGGILNPIFGFLGLLVLLWTLKVTRNEMKDTKEALKNQERELLLARLADTFIKQCESINKCIERFSSEGFNDGFPRYQANGEEVFNNLSRMFSHMDRSKDRRSEGERILAIFMVPNEEKIYSYSEALYSSLITFEETINLYKDDLNPKDLEQLFIIVNANLSYEVTYQRIFILNRVSLIFKELFPIPEIQGMDFLYKKKLAAAEKLMIKINKTCRPDSLISSCTSLDEHFGVQK